MLSQEDLKQISLRGITEEQVEHQLDEIKQGFPFLSFGSFQCFIYDVSRLFFRCANFLSILLLLVKA